MRQQLDMVRGTHASSETLLSNRRGISKPLAMSPADNRALERARGERKEQLCRGQASCFQANRLVRQPVHKAVVADVLAVSSTISQQQRTA